MGDVYEIKREQGRYNHYLNGNKIYEDHNHLIRMSWDGEWNISFSMPKLSGYYNIYNGVYGSNPFYFYVNVGSEIESIKTDSKLLKITAYSLVITTIFLALSLYFSIKKEGISGIPSTNVLDPKSHKETTIKEQTNPEKQKKRVAKKKKK